MCYNSDGLESNFEFKRHGLSIVTYSDFLGENRMFGRESNILGEVKQVKMINRGWL